MRFLVVALAVCYWNFSFGVAMTCTRGATLTFPLGDYDIVPREEVECDVTTTHCIREEVLGNLFGQPASKLAQWICAWINHFLGLRIVNKPASAGPNPKT